MANIGKRGFTPTEIVVYVIIAVVILVFALLFLTGTVGGAGKQTLRVSNVEQACIPTQTLNDCGECQVSCCHCPVKCARADEDIGYQERCDTPKTVQT